ncbi:DNA-directed RNA polymerase subunit beta' [Candidatus Bipolaricaulota bacterium]|nr:DNA-directed RNA polymerase subunit beta' [Candidatus Bipolaricaulota bacterium]
MLSGDDIEEVKLMFASPEEIRSWSHGEVTESETINYRTHKPEKGGLYAEEIFGPEEDYKCACGKYEGKKYEGITCEKCGVLVTDSSVRRQNMGHIELASSVIHFWFLKGISSPLSKLLDIKKKTLRKIAYYEAETTLEDIYIVTSTSEDDRLREGERLYSSELEILSRHLDFETENGMVINEAPQLTAGESGEVEIEHKKLQNGEGIALITLGDEEYPVAEDVILDVSDGDSVEEGDLIAETPVGEVCSETFLDMAKSRYGDEIESEPAEEEIDNLAFLVTSVEDEEIPLEVGEKITQLGKQAYERLYPTGFAAHTGAKGIKGLLENIDLEELGSELSNQLDKETSKTAKNKLSKRLSVVEKLRDSGNSSDDIALEAIPVLPPDLRPIVHLEGGKFATTDLNDLYRRIINRNNRLKRLEDMGAPEVILRNERRMLQESVDALIHNEKKNTPIQGKDDRPLKSLSDRISGKHGRLRRNLLGRRVDYSGRAVIVVDPQLNLDECGVPKKMALELFKPFVTRYLDDTTYSDFNEVKNKALAGDMPEVWDYLDELMEERPVLLNRAPTLHRLGIEAFEPKLVEGDAIHIHPHVCPPYNADFDGDQMAIHLPLTREAVDESRDIMLSSKNLLSPAYGGPLTKPTQDQIYAYYYLTEVDEDGKGEGKFFASLQEAKRAHDNDVISLHAPVKIRIDGEVRDTTLGRAKLNELFPRDLRNYDKRFESSDISEVLMRVYEEYGNERVVSLLDDLKELGFSEATESALTISTTDCIEPEEKSMILEQADERVDEVNEMFDKGLASEEERSSSIVDVWNETVDRVEDATMENYAENKFNPLQMMVGSGARGSADQVKQLSGMRGLMADPSGDVIEMPVKSNFREGLDMMEYFISTHGGRKGTADTALKTADSGYLTRRLVEAVSNIVVREEDCGTNRGLEVDPLRYDGGELMEGIEERVYGKTLAESVIDPEDGSIMAEEGELVGKELSYTLADKTVTVELNELDQEGRERLVGTNSVRDLKEPDSGNVLVSRDETLGRFELDRLEESEVEEIEVRPNIVVRSPVTCETEKGICQNCYGMDMSKHEMVDVGLAAGIVAAQSIGEPGTQLTMRTFHSGGVAGEDITQGLPRAEELFEARKTTKSAQATITDIEGHVTEMTDTEEGKLIEIEGEPQSLSVPSSLCLVEPGEEVNLSEVVDNTSPHAGTVRFVEEDGRPMMYLLMSRTDMFYELPDGIEISVEGDTYVEKGDVLSEELELQQVHAKKSGTVDSIDEERNLITLVDEEENFVDHLIPPMAKPLVEEGEGVEEGEELIDVKSSDKLTADKSGLLVKAEDSVIIFQPEEGRKRIPLSEAMVPEVADGEKVKKGKTLFTLDRPKDRKLVVESVGEEGDDFARVNYRYREDAEVTHSPVVGTGDKVKPGEQLSKGVIPPHNLLEKAGMERTYEYLLTEIQKVYKSQGVDINDTHVEVIIAQMLNNVIVTNRGDSDLTQNELITLEEFRNVVDRLRTENEEIRERCREIIGEQIAEDVYSGGHLIAREGERVTEKLLRHATRSKVEELPLLIDGEIEKPRILEHELPEGDRQLLRISKSALKTKGWLSAASFQRTTSTLTDAALSGQSDELKGLKPNIIVGKKVSVGTGFEPEEDGAESEGESVEAENEMAPVESSSA